MKVNKKIILHKINMLSDFRFFFYTINAIFIFWAIIVVYAYFAQFSLYFSIISNFVNGLL